ncbi:MAG: 4-hydroxy-tetrahydrodipicolinate reductase [Candidatus Fermentibacteraceae bacterium]|nr:4-hydroxy-tetrahydrodipicolinate reductase [Candidatus Fermentibacteraceae bacterium]
MTRVAIFGSAGRMGRLFASQASGKLEIVQTFDKGDNYKLNSSVEVVIDFSQISAWEDLDTLLDGTDVALVSGTTGTEVNESRLLKKWASTRPVFYSSNMSIGIYVLGKLMKVATDMLGDSFDHELVEFHHRNKKDSPSGTALSLLENWPDRVVFGRNGDSGEREPGTAGVHSVRGGDVAGEHHLYFLGDGERLTISHIATDRKIFVAGAVRAAVFIKKKPVGLYGMEDMLE